MRGGSVLSLPTVAEHQLFAIHRAERVFLRFRYRLAHLFTQKHRHRLREQADMLGQALDARLLRLDRIQQFGGDHHCHHRFGFRSLSRQSAVADRFCSLSVKAFTAPV